MATQLVPFLVALSSVLASNFVPGLMGLVRPVFNRCVCSVRLTGCVSRRQVKEGYIISLFFLFFFLLFLFFFFFFLIPCFSPDDGKLSYLMSPQTTHVKLIIHTHTRPEIWGERESRSAVMFWSAELLPGLVSSPYLKTLYHNGSQPF